MSVYGEFFTKFMGPLFEGFIKIFKGLGEGLFGLSKSCDGFSIR